MATLTWTKDETAEEYRATFAGYALTVYQERERWGWSALYEDGVSRVRAESFPVESMDEAQKDVLQSVRQLEHRRFTTCIEAIATVTHELAP